MWSVDQYSILFQVLMVRKWLLTFLINHSASCFDLYATDPPSPHSGWSCSSPRYSLPSSALCSSPTLRSLCFPRLWLITWAGIWVCTSREYAYEVSAKRWISKVHMAAHSLLLGLVACWPEWSNIADSSLWTVCDNEGDQQKDTERQTGSKRLRGQEKTRWIGRQSVRHSVASLSKS